MALRVGECWLSAAGRQRVVDDSEHRKTTGYSQVGRQETNKMVSFKVSLGGTASRLYDDLTSGG